MSIARYLVVGFSIFILMAAIMGCSAVRAGVKAGAKAAPSVADDAGRGVSRQLPSASDDAASRGFKESSPRKDGLLEGAHTGARQLSKLEENLSRWGADQAARELASLTTVAMEALAPRGTEGLMKRVAEEIIVLRNFSSRASATDGTEGLASQLAKGLVQDAARQPTGTGVSDLKTLVAERIRESTGKLDELIDRRLEKLEKDVSDLADPDLSTSPQIKQCVSKSITTLKTHAYKSFVLAQIGQDQAGEDIVDEVVFLDDYLNQTIKELDSIMQLAPGNMTPAARCGRLAATILKERKNAEPNKQP